MIRIGECSVFASCFFGSITEKPEEGISMSQLEIDKNGKLYHTK